MIKKYISSIAIVLGIIILSLYYFSTKSSQPTQQKKKDKIDHTQKAKEYFYSRGLHPKSGYYLWRILHDPATGKIPDFAFQQEMQFAQQLPKAAINKKITWKAMGPNNIGGRTRAVDIDINNDSIMVAGSASGGLWRTSNGGTSWTKVSSVEDQLSITCIAQNKRPGHTNVWYAGSGEATGQSASATGAYFLGNGMYKSTDNGVTWHSLKNTAPDAPYKFKSNWQLMWRIAVSPSPADSGRVYAATLRNIRVSNDGGNTFQSVIGNGGNAYFTDVAVTSSGVAYATLSSDGGSQKGIWRSTDGTNWTNITPDSFPKIFNRIVIGINHQNENQVYFLANTPDTGQVISTPVGTTEGNMLWKYTYLSGDGADSLGRWENFSDHLPHTGTSYDMFYTQGSYDMTIAVKPNDSNIIFIGGTNLYRSTDAFTSDSNISRVGGYGVGSTTPFYTYYPNHHPDEHFLTFMPSDPDVLVSTSDGGIFKTNNCLAKNVVWKSLNNGYRTTQYYTIAIDHGTAGSNVITGGLQDYSSWWTNSSNPATAWKMPTYGDGAYCAVTDGAGMYYFSRQNGKILKVDLDNNGNNLGYTRIDPIGASDYLFVNPFVLNPNDNNMMYLPAGGDLWRNDSLNSLPLNNQYDSISTGWYKFPYQLNDTLSTYTAIGISKNPSNIVYLGTSNGDIIKVTDANSNSNSKFTDITPSKFSNGNISCIAVDPQDANHLVVTFSNYNVYSLFNSVDGGQSWEKCGGNIEPKKFGFLSTDLSCRWVDIMHIGNHTAYFLGTSIGLFATDTLDGLDTHWKQLGANSIGNVVVDMIKSRSADGFVAVATHGNGVYTTHLTDITDVQGIEEIRQNDIKLTVYPNPTQSILHLKYNLEKQSDVHINIYNMSGKLVKTIEEGMQYNGENKLDISVDDFSRGSYILSLSTSHSKNSKSFVVIHE